MTRYPGLRVDTLCKQVEKEPTNEIIAESESHYKERNQETGQT